MFFSKKTVDQAREDFAKTQPPLAPGEKWYTEDELQTEQINFITNMTKSFVKENNERMFHIVVNFYTDLHKYETSKNTKKAKQLKADYPLDDYLTYKMFKIDEYIVRAEEQIRVQVEDRKKPDSKINDFWTDCEYITDMRDRLYIFQNFMLKDRKAGGLCVTKSDFKSSLEKAKNNNHFMMGLKIDLIEKKPQKIKTKFLHQIIIMLNTSI